MHDKAVRRRRAVLAVLVAALAVPAHRLLRRVLRTARLHAVQRGAMEVLAPIQEGANRALKPFRDLFGWFGDTLDAKEQRDKLEAERDQLRSELAAAQRRERASSSSSKGLQRAERPGRARAATTPVAGARVSPARRAPGTRRFADQQGLERRRHASTSRSINGAGPRRQGQGGLRRQRGRDADHRPGVRRLRAGARAAASPAASRPPSARPATCCSSSCRTPRRSARASSIVTAGTTSTRAPAVAVPARRSRSARSSAIDIGDGELDRAHPRQAGRRPAHARHRRRC